MNQNYTKKLYIKTIYHLFNKRQLKTCKRQKIIFELFKNNKKTKILKLFWPLRKFININEDL